MFADSRYVDRIPEIRAELVRCARYKEKTSYKRLGRIVRIPTQGPWQGVLNIVSQQELAEGRPDITHLITNKKTGLSSRIEYRDAHKPTDEQRARSAQIQREAFAYYDGTDD